MRYFKTSNASRRYNAGALAYTFESVSNIGGSWLGVLAVEDASAANTLAAAAFPQVSEITQTEFEDLKKKPQQNSHYRVFQGAKSPPPPDAGRVVQGASTSTVKPAEVPEPVNAQLKTAEIDVPDELKLEASAPKPRKR
jgi:hypothetical protein